ncbi:MAG: hypothetical protein WKF87_06205 [Chryseolinea sp.]
MQLYLQPLLPLFLFAIVSDLNGQMQTTFREDNRQHRESGNYFYKNYTTQDYQAASQNWAVLQDRYGNMVFGNGDGVLTYDGKKWQVVEL